MPKGHFTPYTQEQELKIKKEYLIKPVKVLARETNSSFGRIMRYLNKNNLKIPNEVIKKRIKESQKKKGDTPFNKGMKQKEYMSIAAIEKSKETQFKKGNIPHNINKIGNGAIVERKDSNGKTYKYIRIQKGVWRLLQRVIWENENGKIPDKHLITFKNGDSLDTRIENLELTSMSEQMYRNSKLNYPKELIPSLVLCRQLEIKLNTLENG